MESGGSKQCVLRERREQNNLDNCMDNLVIVTNYVTSLLYVAESFLRNIYSL
jgi:hypothetical protein